MTSTKTSRTCFFRLFKQSSNSLFRYLFVIVLFSIMYHTPFHSPSTLSLSELPTKSPLSTFSVRRLYRWFDSGLFDYYINSFLLLWVVSYNDRLYRISFFLFEWDHIIESVTSHDLVSPMPFWPMTRYIFHSRVHHQTWSYYRCLWHNWLTQVQSWTTLTLSLQIPKI